MSVVPTASGEEALAARPDGAPAAGRRQSVPRRELLFLIAAALVFLIDQVTKSLAVYYLLPLVSVRLAGFFQLTYVENRGAAFGVLQNQTLFFVVLGLVVVAGLALSYRHLPGISPLLNVCLGLQLGGALGNLVDRLRQGYVVDFVDLTWWPVFNVADAAIVLGVSVIAYYLIRGPRASAATDHA